MWLGCVRQSPAPKSSLGVYRRLATGREANHGNGNSPRVKQPARHGAVELGRGPVVLIVRDIVDSIDKGRALAAIPRRVGRNFSGAENVSNGIVRAGECRARSRFSIKP